MGVDETAGAVVEALTVDAGEGATPSPASGGVALGLANRAGTTVRGKVPEGAGRRAGMAGAAELAEGTLDGFAAGSTITGAEAAGSVTLGATGVGAAPLSSAGPAARGVGLAGAGSRKLDGLSTWSAVCAHAPLAAVSAADALPISTQPAIAPRHFAKLTLLTLSCSLKSCCADASLM